MYCTHCGNLETLAETPLKACKLSPCNACNELEILNSKISDAEKILEGLLQQRRELKSRANEVHDLGIHRMPIELASHIFELYVEANLDEERRPFTLGAICQTWRRIAWSTPSLWTRIDITLIPDEDCETDFQFTKEWVDRSGQLPLSIYLLLDERNLKASVVDPFIKLINECSSRWGSLDFNIPCSFYHRFRADSALGTPLLERIRICLEENDRRKFSFGPVKPCPKFVDISGISFRSLDIEWNCVTSVSARIPIDQWMELFDCAARMQECKLIYHWPHDLHTSIASPLIHSKLESLRIDLSCCSDRTVNTFFNSITFPALKSFWCRTTWNFNPTDSLASFFTRSSCRLQEMKLEGETFAKHNLREILRAMDLSAHEIEIIMNVELEGDSEDEKSHSNSDIEDYVSEEESDR